MITNDDVTIIIPVYNGQHFIEECIESCLGQTKNITVVDDASTDKSLLLASSFMPEINVIHLDRNGGTAKALNTGINASNTPFIKWLSADDVLKQDAISQMLELVNKHCYQNNRIFYTHYDIINSYGEYVKEFIEPFIEREKQNSVLLDHFYGNGSTSLIHRDVFTKCGLFNESLGYQEDYEFWLRASCLHDIRLTLLDIKTIDYRIHEHQLTSIHKGESLKKSQNIRDMMYAQKPELRLLSKPDIPIKTKIKRLGRKIIYG